MREFIEGRGDDGTGMNPKDYIIIGYYSGKIVAGPFQTYYEALAEFRARKVSDHGG